MLSMEINSERDNNEFFQHVVTIQALAVLLRRIDRNFVSEVQILNSYSGKSLAWYRVELRLSECPFLLLCLLFVSQVMANE